VIHSAVRSVLDQHQLTEILSPKRAEIMRQITEQADATLRERGIRVDDVRLRRTDYPPANLARIYGRMQTERQRFAKKFRAEGEERARKIRAVADLESQVVLAGAQREATRTRGEGDAEAAAIYADAYSRDREFYAFLRSLEAYRQALDDQTTVILSPNSPFLRYLFQNGAKRPTP
jgi:membrane protease subunit HflC